MSCPTMELEKQFASLQTTGQTHELLVVASTFMENNHECVIAWNLENKKLVRPVTNLKTNSWMLGTFAVGHTYSFVVLNMNPDEAIWPHKSEDVIVKPAPVRSVAAPWSEPLMYSMLVYSSKESVLEVFSPGVIEERKYIIEKTACPSVGILKCMMANIKKHTVPMGSSSKERCKVNDGLEEYDFPITAQNRDQLNNPPADIPVLVLLGLGRPYAGTPDISGPYDPLRCYIMVIGIIRDVQ